MLAGVGKDRDWLARTTYPGRGLAIGGTANGACAVQLYWIMGRSSRSRNRRFSQGDCGVVHVEVADARAGPVTGDTSLILYRASAVARPAPVDASPAGAGSHVVSNGDHTDTIVAGLAGGDCFAAAFASRDVEPDPPHFTARIAGVVNAGGRGGYELAIIKMVTGDPPQASFQHFVYRRPRPGWGHCITTYDGDGSPLPPFTGEPFPLQLAATPRLAVRELWDLLNRNHRVAALAKFIDRATGEVNIEIINRHCSGSGPAHGTP